MFGVLRLAVTSAALAAALVTALEPRSSRSTDRAHGGIDVVFSADVVCNVTSDGACARPGVAAANRGEIAAKHVPDALAGANRSTMDEGRVSIGRISIGRISIDTISIDQISIDQVSIDGVPREPLRTATAPPKTQQIADPESNFSRANSFFILERICEPFGRSSCPI